MNLVEVFVGQLALPVQISPDLDQLAGLLGLATGPDATRPRFLITDKLQKDDVPSRVAVIEQKGIPSGTGVTDVPHSGPTPAGPDNEAEKFVVTFGPHKAVPLKASPLWVQDSAEFGLRFGLPVTSPPVLRTVMSQRPVYPWRVAAREQVGGVNTFGTWLLMHDGPAPSDDVSEAVNVTFRFFEHAVEPAQVEPDLTQFMEVAGDRLIEFALAPAVWTSARSQISV